MLIRTLGNTKSSWIRTAFVLLVCLASSLLVWRDTRNQELPKLVRIEMGANGDSALEVASVKYVLSKNGVSHEIDFIGAVHLGEKEYFEGLNERFKEYDAVLFELIGDPKRVQGMRTNRGQASLLGAVQKRMGEILGLQFQLEIIDYTARNFVHADMTEEQFGAAFTKRGETPLQLLLKLIKLSFDPELKKELEASGYNTHKVQRINPLLLMLRGPSAEERRTLKSFMAHGLLASDKMLKMLEGEIGGVIITDRNIVAVNVVARELAAGKKKIAVYYGVGHLPDMHERFTKELGLKLIGVEWIKAWNLQ